jgi:hypothetical protein
VSLSDGQDTNSTSSSWLLVLRITPVNQAPSFNLSTTSISLEEDETVFLPGFLQNVYLGGWREETQAFELFLTSPPDLPSYVGSFSLACNDLLPMTCNLTYTPGADVFGNVTLTLEMRDDGPMGSVGWNTFSTTFNVSITPLNDPPSFRLASYTLVVREGSACLTDTPEAGEWSSFVEASCNDTLPLTHDRLGYARDVRTGPYEDGPPVPCLLKECEAQTATFSVTVLDIAATDLLFEEVPVVLWPTGRIRFKLKPFVSGKASFNITLTDGNATSPPGNTKSSAQQTFIIDVLNVNSKPSFAHLFQQVRVFEDSGVFSRLFATNITTDGGVLNTEPWQELTFRLVPDRPDLFEELPQVSEEGVLTFKPAQDAFGTCKLLVTLVDDGGRVEGGKDTSDEMELTIVLIKVNDIPTFGLNASVLSYNIPGFVGPALSVPESAGFISFPAFATDIAPGPSNEDGVCFTGETDDTCESQSVKFEIVGISNPLLFFWPPAVSPTGTLTFYAQPNVTGSSTVTIMLVDTGGINATETGPFRGVDLSVTSTFGISVEPVNNAPDFHLPFDVSCQTSAFLTPGSCVCSASSSACTASAVEKSVSVSVLEDAGLVEIAGFASEMTTVSGTLPTSTAYFSPGSTPMFSSLEQDAFAKWPSMEYSVDYALSADGKHLFSAEFETDTIAAFDIGANNELTLTDRRGEGERRLRYETLEQGSPFILGKGACAIGTFEVGGKVFVPVSRGCKPLDEEAGVCVLVWVRAWLWG